MTLDFRYEQAAADIFSERPTRGWIRAVRDALGMTSRQLGERMGISQPAVAQLERSEAAGKIQLDSLRRAAAAMNCEVVYAIVPRTSLEQTVRDRATHVARHDLTEIDRSMRLSERGLSPEELRRRTDEYATYLIASASLWDDPNRP